MNDYTKHLTLGRKSSEYLNQHIVLELDVYKPVHRDILLSIYEIGRGYATRRALSEYFNTDEKTLNKKYLTVLYELGLIYYAGQYSINSLVGLTQYGESYCTKKYIKSFTKVSPENIEHMANKSNYLYKLSTIFGYNTINKAYNKNEHIYKYLIENGINCSLSKDDFFIKLETSNIYFCGCYSNRIVFATLYKNKLSLLTRLNAIYNYISTFTSVYNIVIELIVCTGEECDLASNSIKEINTNNLTNKERDAFLNNIKSSATSSRILETKMIVI